MRMFWICTEAVPEVGELDDSIVSDEAVGAFDVSVCDAVAMEVLQPDQQLTSIGLRHRLLEVSKLIDQCLQYSTTLTALLE